MNNKYFILGLPRTGTTSLCVASLDLGLKTAHTAYTQSTIKTAQLIADTPVYNNFEKLYQLYPNSRFIYLERDMPLWVPSIRQLLTRMRPKLIEKGGGFNETLKRCYLEVFPNLDDESLSNDDYLVDCYQQHKQRVTEFLNITKADCLFVDLAQEQSNRQLAHFMNVSSIKIPHINRKGKVTAWNEIKHPLKIESTRIGKVDKDALLYHFET